MLQCTNKTNTDLVFKSASWEPVFYQKSKCIKVDWTIPRETISPAFAPAVKSSSLRNLVTPSPNGVYSIRSQSVEFDAICREVRVWAPAKVMTRLSWAQSVDPAQTKTQIETLRWVTQLAQNKQKAAAAAANICRQEASVAVDVGGDLEVEVEAVETVPRSGPRPRLRLTIVGRWPLLIRCDQWTNQSNWIHFDSRETYKTSMKANGYRNVYL